METIERHVRRATGALWPVAMGALIVAGLGACGDDESPLDVEGAVRVPDAAAGTPSLSTLSAALEAGDLVAVLDGDGPFTVFAPQNTAFDALGSEKVNVLLEPANQALLQKVLTYHVVAGEVRAADLIDGGTATTLEGSDVTFDLGGASPRVNAAAVVTADVEVDNGVIHIVDAVLTENLDLVDVATLNGFSTLVSLADQAGLVETLRGENGGDGYTVFAPTDDAFAALSSVPEGDALAGVLTYHVVGATVGSGDLSDGQVVNTAQGGQLTVGIDGGDVTLTDGAGNEVNVILTDVPASNGIVHVIDSVLLPE